MCLECEEIELFWQVICRNQFVYSTATASQPTIMQDFLKVHKETLQFVLMAATKVIMVKWVGADSPSVQLWKSLITDSIRLEMMRYCINGKTHLLITKWKRIVELFGIK